MACEVASTDATDCRSVASTGVYCTTEDDNWERERVASAESEAKIIMEVVVVTWEDVTVDVVAIT